jgi:NAD(P)-dependent dehydrogenase (short-subunit alcohol dehydrogenase family)
MAGRRVLVTGATSGIGLATALELARAGFRVTGTARTPQKAQALSDAAADAGCVVDPLVLDVCDAEAVTEAVHRMSATDGGGPWAVVNNAGHAQAGAVEDVDDEKAWRQLAVNLVAPVRIARLVLPGMRERGGGRIVNISSFSGRITNPFMGWYAASKSGLEAISDALRMEAAQFGVRVVLVEPGAFRTGIWARGVADLPTAGQPAYGHLSDLGQALLDKSATMPGPEPVARTVRHALTAARPRARYLVGADVKLAVLLERLLPTAAADKAKAIRTGIRRPQTVPEKVLGELITRFT